MMLYDCRGHSQTEKQLGSQRRRRLVSNMAAARACKGSIEVAIGTCNSINLTDTNSQTFDHNHLNEDTDETIPLMGRKKQTNKLYELIISIPEGVHSGVSTLVMNVRNMTRSFYAFIVGYFLVTAGYEIPLVYLVGLSNSKGGYQITYCPID